MKTPPEQKKKTQKRKKKSMGTRGKRAVEKMKN